MKKPLPRPRTTLLLVLLAGLVLSTPASSTDDVGPIVAVDTPLGSFEIELFPEDAPVTVANFLTYIESGRFEDSFIHRKVAGFIVQGGGFTFVDDGAVEIPTDPPIVNEFKLSNVRGTIAMAKASGDPNSATSQWFINLADNSANLDAQNGGFTVFGRVVGDGMAVVDAIAALPTFNLGSAFTEIPLRNFSGGQAGADNLVFTDFAVSSVPAVKAPLLLRHSNNGSWYSYTLGPGGDGVGIEQEGKVNLTRDGNVVTVSRGDFDGDRRSDVLLRDQGDGSWLLATLRDSTVAAQSSVTLPRGITLEVIATADFNGDRNADVLLQDAATGRWQVWLLRGASVLAGGEVGFATDNFAGVGDFDGDGDDDVLLRSARGNWTVYFVDGPGVTPSAKPKLPRSAKTEAKVVGDLDGDGTADVLTRTSKGKWQAWLFVGGEVRSKGTVNMPRDRGLELVTSADFNGDGAQDVLLRNIDGSWRLYTLQGRRVLGSGMPQMTDDLAYSLVVADDFDRDGVADVLLRSTDGSWLLYTIDGDLPGVASSSVPDLSRQTAWVPQLD